MCMHDNVAVPLKVDYESAAPKKKKKIPHREAGRIPRAHLLRTRICSLVFQLYPFR